MLNFKIIESSRSVLKNLVEICQMYRNSEIKLEASREYLYYPRTANDRFLGFLIEALDEELNIYSMSLGKDCKEDYLYWIVEEGYIGYERVLLDLHRIVDRS